MRLLATALAALLATASAPDACEALNVTVSPGPRVQFSEGDNATLYCHISQKRKTDNLLAVRWVFAASPTQEHLMIKMTKFGSVQYYGNYSQHFHKQRLHLLKEKHGTLYKFLILSLQQTDQGHYICKVQEIGKHRNKWTAWSNGTAATEIRVISSKSSDHPTFKKNHEAWKFFEDLYVYAVFVCSIGIISVLLFTLVILCQSLLNKKRSTVKHYLVKCPQNRCKFRVILQMVVTFMWIYNCVKCSGETVTSVTSMSPLQPKKVKKKKEKEKLEQPPAIPAKAPIANNFPKPKLLKPQRKLILPKIAEENLTYAELELMKPIQEAKGISSMTVYAQILFEENKL
ncbi:PREDICTED: V-set and transmembrane domain-containing protein 4 isoform X1 [Pseudopodoces humilis]|uniref:V-set and transmembrane domain-containing protein 4 isoform X1 n=1 Tax=Pseudopodoces humilis TaxID=181119 RepID=UPI0006B71233|nr:PREDICTED: V-set and transmembrane domain-containing protein 4 isoform X1 [Pseudopodoces humilis]